MAELTSLNIKIDRDLKSQADQLFNAMGMTLSTAVNVFVRQAVQEQAIPFKIHLNDMRGKMISSQTLSEETPSSAMGIFEKYANPNLIPNEKDAWGEAVKEKHANY